MALPRIRPRVSVVDDEPVIASTVTTILLHSGYEANAFTEPLEVLKAAHLRPPDLLISDVIMTTLSGIELADRLREFCPNCKILLFSGQAATANLLENARADGHDFEVLGKPVHPKDLLRKIQEVTGQCPPLPSMGELFAGL